jgi:hypothetical protein
VVTLVEFWAMASLMTLAPVSMPRLSAIGSAPAATFFRPSWTMACPRTVAVVVPSPAMSFVFEAISLASWAPMFSKGSASSISLAMVTPSFVMVGGPKRLSSTTLRPRGPRVMRTAPASWSMPSRSAWRACSSNLSCLAIYSPYLSVAVVPSFGTAERSLALCRREC